MIDVGAGSKLSPKVLTSIFLVWHDPAVSMTAFTFTVTSELLYFLSFLEFDDYFFSITRIFSLLLFVESFFVLLPL